MLTFQIKSLKSLIKPSLIIRFYSNREEVRVRFAPSPTGFLHLGGLRTALYNYLFAKAHRGKFILRIEDTDQTRLVDEASNQLQNDLQWSGIQIDEGPNIGGNLGPYIQSQRLSIYNEQVKYLLNNGTAYHCFCSERRLDLLRKEALRSREVPKYDNRCRHLKPEEVQEKLEKGVENCIRFKLTPGVESFNDLIYGTISYDIAANEGDPVIMKSDGYPTYHFANVVDDHLMKITHVLRGVEWQISTTKHLSMYRAFNWKPPLFGHLPLLMNADGTKLSKRQGDIHISYYKETGIFPLALINFIAHSGGGFTKDSEQNVKSKCWSIDELAQQFHISRINSHSGKLMSDRLLEFNRLELKRRLKNGDKELVNELRNMIKKTFPENEKLELSYSHISHILNWSVNRISKLSDLLTDDLKFIWVSPKSYTVSDAELSFIPILIEDLNRLNTLEKENLGKFFKEFSKRHGVKFGSLMKSLRTILSGLKEGPGVAEMVEILGKENSLSRLRNCIKKHQLR